MADHNPPALSAHSIPSLAGWSPSGPLARPLGIALLVVIATGALAALPTAGGAGAIDERLLRNDSVAAVFAALGFAGLAGGRLQSGPWRGIKPGSDEAPTGIAFVAFDGSYLYVNQGFASLLGSTVSELEDGSLLRSIHPDDRDLLQRTVGAAMAPGSTGVSVELRMLRPSGEGTRVRLEVCAVRSHAGRPDHLMAVVSPIRASEAPAALADDDAAPPRAVGGDGLYRTDAEGRILFANPAACRLLDRDLDELLGADAHSLFHHSRADGSPLPERDCSLRGARTSGSVVRSAETFWRPDGTPVEVDCTSAPVRDRGAIVGSVTVFSDCSDERRRERDHADELASRSRPRTGVEQDDLAP